jgi:hypothetical protein
MTEKNFGHEGLLHSDLPDSVNDLTEEALLRGLSELMKPGSRLCLCPHNMHFTADQLKKYFGWTDEMIDTELRKMV